MLAHKVLGRCPTTSIQTRGGGHIPPHKGDKAERIRKRELKVVLHSKFRNTLGYMRPYFKKKEEEERGGRGGGRDR